MNTSVTLSQTLICMQSIFVTWCFYSECFCPLQQNLIPPKFWLFLLFIDSSGEMGWLPWFAVVSDNSGFLLLLLVFVTPFNWFSSTTGESEDVSFTSDKFACSPNPLMLLACLPTLLFVGCSSLLSLTLCLLQIGLIVHLNLPLGQFSLRKNGCSRMFCMDWKQSSGFGCSNLLMKSLKSWPSSLMCCNAFLMLWPSQSSIFPISVFVIAHFPRHAHAERGWPEMASHKITPQAQMSWVVCAGIETALADTLFLPVAALSTTIASGGWQKPQLGSNGSPIGTPTPSSSFQQLPNFLTLWVSKSPWIMPCLCMCNKEIPTHLRAFVGNSFPNFLMSSMRFSAVVLAPSIAMQWPGSAIALECAACWTVWWILMMVGTQCLDGWYSFLTFNSHSMMSALDINFAMTCWPFSLWIKRSLSFALCWDLLASVDLMLFLDIEDMWEVSSQHVNTYQFVRKSMFFWLSVHNL